MSASDRLSKRARRSPIARRFTPSEVIAIRRQCETETFARVARHWGIASSLAAGIKHGLYYGDVREGIVAPNYRRKNDPKVETKQPKPEPKVADLCVGDVVQMRTGDGPRMVVTSTWADGEVSVTWWTDQGPTTDRVDPVILARAS